MLSIQVRPQAARIAALIAAHGRGMQLPLRVRQGLEREQYRSELLVASLQTLVSALFALLYLGTLPRDGDVERTLAGAHLVGMARHDVEARAAVIQSNASAGATTPKPNPLKLDWMHDTIIPLRSATVKYSVPKCGLPGPASDPRSRLIEVVAVEQV